MRLYLGSKKEKEKYARFLVASTTFVVNDEDFVNIKY